MKLTALVLALTCTLFAQASAPPHQPLLDTEQCSTNDPEQRLDVSGQEFVITNTPATLQAVVVSTDQVVLQEPVLVDKGTALRSKLPAANYVAAGCCGDGGGWSSPWTSQRFAHPLVAAFASLLLALAFWRSHVRSRLHASL